ncbi:hypothetical protein JOC37_002597 [Desulfohalotomaculum tongense]|uniref:hypothetical protein n=1 Tax=Desulforadius tongensis TaxID=1216062 RepID=UPI0019571512|nr:hypothetical protein [Desulforadius tongensis]MBM7856164.1 hypothetical protein [Desulforadius tongensis]
MWGKKVGKLLVTFCPGEAVGFYSEGENEIRDIAEALGNFIDRVFDMYFQFSDLADKGVLLRREYGRQKGAITVSFYYPPGVNIVQKRQQVVNFLLGNYLQSSLYPRPGLYVVQNNGGNYKLIKRTILPFIE